MTRGYRIRQGNIVDSRCEAIVNAWNRNFIPHWLLLPQGVSGAIRRAAGSEPFREVWRFGLLDVGQAVATGAGKLPAPVSTIIHVAALHAYWVSSERAVAVSVENLFALAHELGVRSIAIPLLGAGTGGVEPSRSFSLIAAGAESSGLEVEIWIYEQAVYDDILSPTALLEESGPALIPQPG